MSSIRCDLIRDIHIYRSPLFTPVNIILFSLLGILAYIQLRPRREITLPKHPPPVVFRTFTPRTLIPYNGRGSSSSSSSSSSTKHPPTDSDKFLTEDNPSTATLEDKKEIYIAVRGAVYDVTPGKQFYGPRGPYANFAGRDASRGLALGSFDEDVLTLDLDGELDDLGDLDDEQKESLDGWEERFRGKYLCVGRLVSKRGWEEIQKRERERVQRERSVKEGKERMEEGGRGEIR